MISWTEKFGRFYTNSLDWDSRKEIFLHYDEQTTEEEMVIMALALAKKYNCKIVEKVHFTPSDMGGRVSFAVQCHQLTYRYFYEYGRTVNLHGSQVTEKDLQKYEQQFGTRRCTDDGFKKKYWFRDNWNGEQHCFPSLKKAKEAAAQQTGMSCTIYENQPYGRGSRIVCFTPASGLTPP